MFQTTNQISSDFWFHFVVPISRGHFSTPPKKPLESAPSARLNSGDASQVTARLGSHGHAVRFLEAWYV